VLAIVGAPRVTSTVAAGTRATLASGVKILLAEDDPINIMVARRFLERIGAEVTVAEDGARALLALEQGRFVLALMDVQMPELDGLEVTRRHREHERARGGHLPIVALTAHSMKGDRERFLAAGMDDYLSKSLDPARLGEVVRRFAPEAPAERVAASPPPAGGARGGSGGVADRQPGSVAPARGG
jgi:CheY-like chemotaxis protein